MSWEDLKRELMAKLEEEKSKGLVDIEVVPYLDLINSLPFFATSSSCYGRIVLIDIPTGSKKDSRFLEKWHRRISSDEFWEAITNAGGKKIWFKVEPLILHVSSKSIDYAKRLLDVKMRAGIKKGGIFSIRPDRIRIEIEGTQRMEVPVKFGNKVLIDEGYGNILVEEANKKLQKNAERWERFEEEFKKEFKEMIKS